MRLLFVADGRSPTTLSWLRHWSGTSMEIHLISTFPCEPPPGVSSFHVIPVALGGLAGVPGSSPRKQGTTSTLLRRLRPLRYLLGPVSLRMYRRHFLSLVASIRPDLVHAMRIPFEGMLAAETPVGIPLVVSIWGNDLTLHAPRSAEMQRLTRRVLRRADGLMADARRDVRLGLEWGFRSEAQTLVVPGNGGIRTDIFYPALIPPQRPVVLNPRGIRDYLRNDTFFRAIPLVLIRQPLAFFVCAAMAGWPEAQAWVDQLNLTGSVELLETYPHARMGELFRTAWVVVSPSTHDGTPNSLLEAMACGCFPIAGDLESLREWITPGKNGLLIDPSDPQAMAEAILTALEKPDLRAAARQENARIIAERAEYERCMAMVEAFYGKIANPSGLPEDPLN